MFAPICREIFTLSFEIMVILDWTSPLKLTFSDAPEKSPMSYVHIASSSAHILSEPKFAI